MRKHYKIIDYRGILIRYGSVADKTIEDEEGNLSIVSAPDMVNQVFTSFYQNLFNGGVVPADIICVEDKGNTYRTRMFADYKKSRKEKKSSEIRRAEINKAYEILKKILLNLGSKFVHVMGEEADDIIALLSERLDATMEIFTGDEDLIQLLSPKVSINHAGKSYLYETDYVGEKTNKGTPIRFIALHKSLCGDSSDGYKGVTGFGPAKFTHLLESYGIEGLEQLETCVATNDFKTVEAAHKATDDKVLLMLLEHWSEWRLGYRLAKTNPEACYGAYMGEPKRPQWQAVVPDHEALKASLAEAGIPFYYERIKHFMPVFELIDSSKHQRLTSEIAKEILESPVVAWDYEASDNEQHENLRIAAKNKDYVDVLEQKLAGISICYGRNNEKTVYIPFDHIETNNFPIEWGNWIISLLDKKDTVVHNAAYETAVTVLNLSVWPKAPMDTAIMAMYADENEEVGLKDLSKRCLNYKQASYQETTNGLKMNELTAEYVLNYACDDSLVTVILSEILKLQLQCEKMWDFYVSREVEPIIDDTYSFIAGTPLASEEIPRLLEEDQAKISEARQTLGDALTEHLGKYSQEENMAAATTLFKERLEELRAKAADMQKSAKLATASEVEQYINQKKGEMWKSVWEACFYTPHKSEYKEVEFVSTSTNITKVAQGISKGAPKLTSIKASEVEDWECYVQDHVDELREKKMEAEANALHLFAGLVFSARHVLGSTKRKGPEYEALKNFAAPFFSGKKKLVSEHGDEFNFGSPKQMQELLYCKLKLPIRHRSKKQKGSLRQRHKLPGSPGTGVKAIQSAFAFDISDKKDWRRQPLEAYMRAAAAGQNISLYYTPYPNWVHPRDGLLHPQIKNCGTVTRRPAGGAPNVLAVSHKEENKIRNLFIATGKRDEEPHVYVSIDWQSQELLILACESKDPALLDAFTSNPRKDIHSVTGSRIAPSVMPHLDGPAIGVMSYEEFMEIRKDKKHKLNSYINAVRAKYAKATNFGLAYGGTEHTLAKNLLVDIKLAEALLNNTFSMYNRIQPWQKEVIYKAKEVGYSETAYGNRRHATKELWSSDKQEVQRMERQLVNAVIQGTAADILKEARQKIRDRGLVAKHGMKSIKPIYDEFTSRVPVSKAVDYVMEMKDVMQITPPGYPVGLLIDVEIGNTWGDQIELDSVDRESIQQALEKLGHNI